MDEPGEHRLLRQIVELEGAVSDMKTAFASAVTQLQGIPKCDTDVREEEECGGRLLDTIISMKCELAYLKGQMAAANEATAALQRQVRSLVREREPLPLELLKSSSGGVTDQYGHGALENRTVVGRSSSGSGSHSNDSGVGHRDLRECLRRENIYDSDSSLANAANKSLALTESLGQRCGLELAERRACVGKEEDQNAHEDDDEDLRLEILEEMAAAERAYCKTLRALLSRFAEPLKENGIMDARDVSTLFPDEIRQMHVRHRAFLSSLNARIKAWNHERGVVADIISNFIGSEESGVLRLYKSYANDFPEILVTFRKLCEQSERFTKFMKTCAPRTARGGLDLGASLLAPAGRIPRFVLHLKKMLRHTTFDHPDRSELEFCLSRLGDLVHRLNDTMEHSFQLLASRPAIDSETDVRQNQSRTRNQFISLSESVASSETEISNEEASDEEEITVNPPNPSLVPQRSHRGSNAVRSEPNLSKEKGRSMESLAFGDCTASSNVDRPPIAKSASSYEVDHSCCVHSETPNVTKQTAGKEIQKRKISLRSSLKNMLLFKRRTTSPTPTPRSSRPPFEKPRKAQSSSVDFKLLHFDSPI